MAASWQRCRVDCDKYSKSILSIPNIILGTFFYISVRLAPAFPSPYIHRKPVDRGLDNTLPCQKLEAWEPVQAAFLNVLAEAQ